MAQFNGSRSNLEWTHLKESTKGATKESLVVLYASCLAKHLEVETEDTVKCFHLDEGSVFIVRRLDLSQEQLSK